mgnify:CR=1 FL=1
MLSALLINPHKRFLFLLLITGNLLVLTFSIRKLKLLDQRAMVVYSIPGHTALEFIHGRESVFFGDSILLAQPRTASLKIMIDAELWALRKKDCSKGILTGSRNERVARWTEWETIIFTPSE